MRARWAPSRVEVLPVAPEKGERRPAMVALWFDDVGVIVTEAAARRLLSKLHRALPQTSAKVREKR